MNNYQKLLEVCKTFSSSQGFYGCLLNDLLSLNDDEIEAINNDSTLSKCKDDLDIILYLES